MIKWTRNPRAVCGIPQTSLGLRGHLITNLPQAMLLVCNSIVDKSFQAYNMLLLIIQTPVRLITL